MPDFSEHSGLSVINIRWSLGVTTTVEDRSRPALSEWDGHMVI
ncbi:unnamed protein product, partial [Vitis vinifera]|uniref:Uncharacterized protein n=1 Tax=Vitis vinifera TaxID=29760 RepID=E0CRB3_VITVI